MRASLYLLLDGLSLEDKEVALYHKPQLRENTNFFVVLDFLPTVLHALEIRPGHGATVSYRLWLGVRAKG